MTPKQQRFCEEYLVDLNATQAAIRAGYSAKTARRIASENLTKPDIAKRIDKLTGERSQRIGRDADDVIRRLWQIVEADVTDAFSADGLPVNPTDIPERLKAALASIKLGDSFEIKTNDRLKALELLGKHYGLFVDRSEVDVRAAAQVKIYLPANGREAPSKEVIEDAKCS